MNRVLKDGTTLRDHFESVERQTKRRPPELDGPPCPEPLRYLLRWFSELHLARGSSGFGENPIGYVDIAAWSRLTRKHVTPYEVAALVAVDRAYLNVMASDG